MNNLLNMFKDNQKLKYAVNIFILLVIISLILKLDASKNTRTEQTNSAQISSESQEVAVNYADSLEKRLKNILLKIENMESVDVMIYTKNTPEMKPVYDENISNETNIETGSGGTKKEVKDRKSTRLNSSH